MSVSANSRFLFNEMITHLSFDLWGTLITPNPDYRQHRVDMFRDAFGVELTHDDIKRGKSAVDYISEVSGVQLSYPQTLALCLGDKMHSYPKECFNTATIEFRRLNDIAMEMFHPFLIQPYIVDLLRDLKDSGFSMNILSNTSIIPGSSLRIALKKLGIDVFFEDFLFSDEWGMAKPNPKFYNLIENVSKKPLQECLHIGDNSYSDSGASVVKSFILSNKKGSRLLDLKPYVVRTNFYKQTGLL